MNGKSAKLNSANRLKEMDAFYKHTIKSRLFKEFPEEPLCIRNVIERFDGMLDYNVPHGKKIRGLCAYESLAILLNLNLDDESIQADKNLMDQALAISWCIEFVGVL